MPETYDDVVMRLMDVPLAEMSPTERSAWNQATWNLGPDRVQAIVDQYRAPNAKAAAAAEDAEAGADEEGEGFTTGSTDAEPRARGNDAAPLSHAELELEARGLYGKSLKNLREILNDKRATNQDRLQAASHLRLAASIGQSEPAPTTYRLPMASLLGAAPPTQVDPPSDAPEG